MREQKQYIPDIFAEASKRKETNSRKDKLSGEIAGKLGTLITEHGGWDNKKGEVVCIDSFPMFDGEEGLETDNFYDVKINFAATRKDNSLPDQITVKVHKNGQRYMKDLFTVKSTYTEGHQLFRIDDSLGREISEIKNLKKLNELTDIMCKYGQKHLPVPSPSN